MKEIINGVSSMQTKASQEDRIYKRGCLRHGTLNFLFLSDGAGRVVGFVNPELAKKKEKAEVLMEVRMYLLTT